MALYSAVEDFDDEDAGHYYVWLHDCAADGTDCQEILRTDRHIDEWDGGGGGEDDEDDEDDSNGFVLKNLALASIDHTFNAGRMLRFRLMFNHNPMWVAMTEEYPTRITIGDIDP